MHPNGFTFSDGTHLPVGTTVGAPLYAIHHDECFYQNATSFDGLRFYKQRTAGTTERVRRAAPLVVTTDTFLQFGHGKNGW
jgi:cytochrome P450